MEKKARPPRIVRKFYRGTDGLHSSCRASDCGCRSAILRLRNRSALKMALPRDSKLAPANVLANLPLRLTYLRGENESHAPPDSLEIKWNPLWAISTPGMRSPRHILHASTDRLENPPRLDGFSATPSHFQPLSSWVEHNCVSTSLFKAIIEKDPDPAGGCENIYRGTRSVCGAEAFASMLVCPPHLAFTTCQMRGLKLLKFDVFHKSMPTSMSGLNRDGILPVLSNAMRTNCVFSP